MREAIVTFVIFIAVATGCSDQCKTSESKCDGSTVLQCGGNDTEPFYFGGGGSDTCASVCVDSVQQGDRVAFCALESTPDPACVGETGWFCEGQDVVACEVGYVTARISCTSCMTTTSQVVPLAFCETDLTCTTSDETSCANGMLGGCIAGHAVAMTCAPERCAAVVKGFSECY